MTPEKALRHEWILEGLPPNILVHHQKIHGITPKSSISKLNSTDFLENKFNQTHKFSNKNATMVGTGAASQSIKKLVKNMGNSNKRCSYGGSTKNLEGTKGVRDNRQKGGNLQHMEPKETLSLTRKKKPIHTQKMQTKHRPPEINTNLDVSQRNPFSLYPSGVVVAPQTGGHNNNTGNFNLSMQNALAQTQNINLNLSLSMGGEQNLGNIGNNNHNPGGLIISEYGGKLGNHTQPIPHSYFQDVISPKKKQTLIALQNGHYFRAGGNNKHNNISLGGYTKGARTGSLFVNNYMGEGVRDNSYGAANTGGSLHNSQLNTSTHQTAQHSAHTYAAFKRIQKNNPLFTSNLKSKIQQIFPAYSTDFSPKYIAKGPKYVIYIIYIYILYIYILYIYTQTHTHTQTQTQNIPNIYTQHISNIYPIYIQYIYN